MKMNSLQTVILVGGRGTRLKSLTDNLPKPMVPVQGRPFLEILLRLLQSKGLSRFLLLTGYLHDVISDYFGDGSKFGISIEYSTESDFLGTAGALKNAGYLLEEEFLLLNGDTFSDINYDEFLKFSRNKNTICTMLCYNGPLYDHTKYNLNFERNHVIIDYSKTATGSRFNAIDAGLYFARKEILSIIKNRVSSLETEIFPLLISAKQLSGFATQRMFYDIGTIERLTRFSEVFLSKKTYNLDS